MLLSNLGERKKRLQNAVNSSLLATVFYQELQEGKYQIRFSYDEGGNSILYEAFNADFSTYHSLILDLRREAVNLTQVSDIYSAALLLYLSDREEDASEEYLKEVYGAIYSKLEPLSRLSLEEAAYRVEHQRDFDELSSLIVDALTPKKAIEVEKIDLLLDFFDEPYEEKKAVEAFVLTGSKTTRIKAMSSLFRALYQGGDVPLYGGKSIHISPESIVPNVREALRLLSSSSAAPHFRNNPAYCYINEKDIPAIFALLLGQKIMYEGEVRHIKEDVVSPALMIDHMGELVFDTDIRDGSYLVGDTYLVYVPENKKQDIVIIQFDSPAKKALFQFLLDHPHFQFAPFRHEMDTTIIPMVEGEAYISPIYREKHPSQKPEIHCQIAYTDDDGLDIETTYLVGSLPVDKEAFASTPIGEARQANFLLALEALGLPEYGTVKDQNIILAFLKADLTTLSSSCALMLSENIAGKKVRNIGKFNLTTKSNLDWLEVSVSSNEYSREEFEKILSAYRHKKKFVRIRGEFVSLAEEDDEFGLGRAVEDFSLGEDGNLDSPRLPLYQAFKLPEYENGHEVEYTEEIRNLLGEIKDYSSVEVPLKDSVRAKLRPYQLEGVKWLYVHARRRLSGILADEMGLGKTLQTIALLGTLEEQSPFLIVCPKSLIYNWQNEFQMWDNSIKAIVLTGTPQERESTLKANEHNRVALITSYDSLRNDSSFYEGVHFAAIVLDEGQNIANVYAKKTKAVKNLDASHRFVLTGTPIQNSLADLWSIFDFMMPGYFEPYKQFNYIYGTLGEGMEATKQLLMDKIAPFILKRTKKDVLKDLPPKEERLLIVAMNDEQRRLYDAYFEKINFSRFEGKLQILAALTRLREICVDPAIFLENAEDVSEKMNVAIDLIRQAISEGHKILLFSTFATALKHLLSRLEEIGIPASFIYGDTPSHRRIELAEEFNKTSKVKVMLVSLKAGGTGLNLVGADTVIHLDPWWNLAAETQASDRAHRIGQKRRVTIFKLICKDTVEEKVIQLQEMKRELASVVAEGDEGLQRISLEDLRFLLN